MNKSEKDENDTMFDLNNFAKKNYHHHHGFFNRKKRWWPSGKILNFFKL